MPNLTAIHQTVCAFLGEGYIQFNRFVPYPRAINPETTFGLFLWRLLQVRSGPQRLPKKKLWLRSLSAQMPFLSPNQHCQCSKQCVMNPDNVIKICTLISHRPPTPTHTHHQSLIPLADEMQGVQVKL